MSIQSEIERLVEAKNDIATSIENKGVTVPSNTLLSGMPSLIDQITGDVTSVNGQTGDVVLSAIDVGALASDVTYVQSVNGSSGTVQIAIPSNLSDLNNDSGFITGMTILSYGSSTWNDFLTAYNANKVVYCRASSNSNPATGNQTRMAFMAYVNANPPTNVEFQYYRSVNTHSATQQGDQVYVYKLDKSAGWTVTVRENYTKIVAGTGLSSTYSSGTLTLKNTETAPEAATATPIVSGTGAVGTSVKYAREDHVHPAQTTINGHTVASDVPSNAVFTDTTYESKTAVSGGTDLSLVTTGEKYVWNSKYDASNPPPYPVTSVNGSTGAVTIPTLPSVSSSDNDKVLKVVSGAWAAAVNSSDIYFGVCETGAAYYTKTVSISGVTELYEGLSIYVQFKYGSGTTNTITLNVNSLGAVDIWYGGTYGADAATRFCKKGDIVHLIYHNSTWFVLGCATASEDIYGATRLISDLDSWDYDATYAGYSTTPKYVTNELNGMIAPRYTQTTYSVGDLVTRRHKIYECNTAIATAESWNSSHWTELDPLAKQVKDLATLPSVTSSDNGKVLRVVSGAWSAVELPSASGVSF